MHHAHSARVRSACLSRQVGAALVDADGTIVATGTNEAPKAGGGVYGERITLKSVEDDHRCAFRETVYCSSTTEQNSIIGGLIDEFPSILNEMNRAEATKKLKKTRIGQLVEFSRAVHAEMDAILSAGRDGFSTVGSRLFVTTYPCHYCARHIVSAGVYEVQFIEPYPKSLALKLHDDAIETDFDKWVAPEKVSVRALKDEDNLESDIHRAGKVLFRPFVGVAPRMYLLAFEKTRELKNKETGEYQKGEDAWGGNWSAYTSAYPDLEAVLISNSLSR
jgi:deoxycytidylate deaminase